MGVVVGACAGLREPPHCRMAETVDVHLHKAQGIKNVEIVGEWENASVCTCVCVRMHACDASLLKWSFGFDVALCRQAEPLRRHHCSWQDLQEWHSKR